MKTNLTYVKKRFGVNPNKKFVKCVLDFEINLDKVPGIELLAEMPEFTNLINTLVYCKGVNLVDIDSMCNESEYGTLVFTTEALAKCAPNDEFDQDLGEKLAMTRAQKQAFRVAESFYSDVQNVVINKFDGLWDLLYGSLFAAENCKAHEYELTGYTPEYNAEVEA